MSVDATIATWQIPKSKISSTEKLFLLSCADRAGEQGICWPSITRLCADTCLDRKTVIAIRQSVIDKGFLRYTGETKGKTNSVPVMQLTYVLERHKDEELSSPKNGTAIKLINIEGVSSPENGTAKQSRKRDTEPKRSLNLKDNIYIPDFEKSGMDNYTDFVSHEHENEKSDYFDNHQKESNQILESQAATTSSDKSDYYYYQSNKNKSLISNKIQLQSKKEPKKIKLSHNPKNYQEDERFMRFYDSYPKKIDPRDAWKAFKSIVGDNDLLLEQIIADVELRKTKHSQWRDRQYIKYPAVYLRKGEYLGEIYNAEDEIKAKRERDNIIANERRAMQERASQERAANELLLQKQKQMDAKVYRDLVKKIPNDTQLRALQGLKNILRT